jgi:hypothetical protein
MNLTTQTRCDSTGSTKLQQLNLHKYRARHHENTHTNPVHQNNQSAPTRTPKAPWKKPTERSKYRAPRFARIEHPDSRADHSVFGTKHRVHDSRSNSAKTPSKGIGYWGGAEVHHRVTRLWEAARRSPGWGSPLQPCAPQERGSARRAARRRGLADPCPPAPTAAAAGCAAERLEGGGGDQGGQPSSGSKTQARAPPPPRGDGGGEHWVGRAGVGVAVSPFWRREVFGKGAGAGARGACGRGSGRGSKRI